ncbi:hypothetical protein H2248_005071 [Termitomyces sp. 'cryptogamus']|nr:hypothetical protein H2248_005071 [Termitomyces sp. 'cryptogamus']
MRFEDNTSSKWAYRVGIDVSKEGENPQLCVLFFRLGRLAELPLMPLFVFDGRQRQKVECTHRGSKMGKSGSRPSSKKLKEMIEAFGMECREALDEAGAELAYLNSKGYIDAILTDDCDAFVFGGRTIIKHRILAQTRSILRSQSTSTDRIRDLTRGGLVLTKRSKVGEEEMELCGGRCRHSLLYWDKESISVSALVHGGSSRLLSQDEDIIDLT